MRRGRPDEIMAAGVQETKRAALHCVLFVSWLLSLSVSLFPSLSRAVKARGGRATLQTPSF